MEANRKPLIAAGVVPGMGLGGFVDGIVFHQILQIHNMLSAQIPNTDLAGIEVNMFWDGLFHAFTWIMTAIGLGLLWRAAKRGDVPWIGSIFVGGLILGWGIFNVVEGLIDHYILHVHHVVESQGLSIYDHMFVGSGVLFIIMGLFMTLRRIRGEWQAADDRYHKVISQINRDS